MFRATARWLNIFLIIILLTQTNYMYGSRFYIIIGSTCYPATIYDNLMKLQRFSYLFCCESKMTVSEQEAHLMKINQIQMLMNNLTMRRLRKFCTVLMQSQKLLI